LPQRSSARIENNGDSKGFDRASHRVGRRKARVSTALHGWPVVDSRNRALVSLRAAACLGGQEKPQTDC